MRSKFALLLVAAVVLFSDEARSAPCAGFTDVDTTNPFCTEVAWVKNRGITTGCTTTTLYCPNDPVSRLQMAIFMYRQGNVTVQLGGNASVGTARLGTTNFQPVEIIANNARGLRIEPNGASPNIIAGISAVTNGSFGGTVAGGGSDFGIFVSGRSCRQGCINYVTDNAGTVGGGIGNEAGNEDGNPANAEAATVGGGFDNWSAGLGATISGGLSNRASGNRAVVAGGADNTAPGNDATVAGGIDNQALGAYSFVAGGFSNRAVGPYSFAAGRVARADQRGCLVLSDASSANATSCFAQNEVVVRGVGGFYFWTAGTDDGSYSGARLATGTGGWGAYSDVAGKEAFTEVDPQDILQRLSRMKIGTWQWKHEPGAVRHIGPTAQDFQAAFGVGSSDKHIVTVDADGVALAAIQGVNGKLDARLAERDVEAATLKAELSTLRESVVALRAALSELARRLPLHDR